MLRRCLTSVPFLLLLLVAGVSAHVEMKEPPPRHSQFSKFYLDNDDVDYNMKSPLGPIVGYPCRNFKAGPTQGTMVAGHPFHVQFDGIATHLGGDCQFAVSYDNGTSFAVIWDKLSSCFLDTTEGGYDVPVPDTIPAAKKAIFAWTWINGMGSREYYMNCADVRIENYGHQEPLTAHELLVVNLPGKPTVMPKTGREEDRLIPLLKQRQFITVGKPQDLAREELSQSSNVPGEPDPMANRVAEVDEASGPSGAESTLPDEITSYVYTTRTVIDDENGDAEPNLDAGYTYSELDDYRSRAKTGHGLTVLSDDAEINEYLGGARKPALDASLAFGADDHRLGINGNLDLWPASSGSPVPIDVGTDGSHSPLPLDLGLPPAPSESAKDSIITQFKTVTVNNTPVLQVVVQSNNTAVPSSLTISY